MNARFTKPEAVTGAAEGRRIVKRRCCALCIGPESNSSSGFGNGESNAVPERAKVRVSMASAPLYRPAVAGVNSITKTVASPGAIVNGALGPEDIRKAVPVTWNVAMGIGCAEVFCREKLH